MKSAGKMLKNSFIAFISIFCGIFLCTCGLETVVYVDPPTINQSSLYSSEDFLTWYSSFDTYEINQANSFNGTNVYYKIYNNSSTLVSQRDAILAVNTASNGSQAATRMLETYSYQPLGTSPDQKRAIFVPKKGFNQRLILRLKSYKPGYDYPVDNIYTLRSCVICDNNVESYVAYRNGNTKSFDFFDDNDEDSEKKFNVEPVEGDSDYCYSATSSQENTYYVQMFAVGVAWDSSNFTNSYSLVLDLGSVPIRKDN